MKECLEQKWNWLCGSTSHIQFCFRLHLLFFLSLTNVRSQPWYPKVIAHRTEQPRPHHTRPFFCLPWNSAMALTRWFTSLAPEPCRFLPLPSESWAQGAVLRQLPSAFVQDGWGKRKKEEQSQLFPAAVANQSKLQTQTAHSISVSGHPEAVCVGAKLLSHIPRGVGGKELHGGWDARWFLNHFWRLSLGEGKQSRNPGFFLATSAAGNSRCRYCFPAYGQACIPVLFSSTFFAYLNLL